MCPCTSHSITGTTRNNPSLPPIPMGPPAARAATQGGQIRATWARTRAMKAARAAEVERSRSYCARKNERRRRPHIGFSARISTLRPGSPPTRRVIHHGEP
jgi:hypothetical protein